MCLSETFCANTKKTNFAFSNGQSESRLKGLQRVSENTKLTDVVDSYNFMMHGDSIIVTLKIIFITLGN